MKVDLSNAQAGDEILIDVSRHSRRILLRKVARVTKTMIVDDSGWRWRKRDGRAVGENDPWFPQRVIKLEPKELPK